MRGSAWTSNRVATTEDDRRLSSAEASMSSDLDGPNSPLGFRSWVEKREGKGGKEGKAGCGIRGPADRFSLIWLAPN